MNSKPEKKNIIERMDRVCLEVISKHTSTWVKNTINGSILLIVQDSVEWNIRHVVFNQLVYSIVKENFTQG